MKVSLTMENASTGGLHALHIIRKQSADGSASTPTHHATISRLMCLEQLQQWCVAGVIGVNLVLVEPLEDLLAVGLRANIVTDTTGSTAFTHSCFPSAQFFRLRCEKSWSWHSREHAMACTQQGLQADALIPSALGTSGHSAPTLPPMRSAARLIILSTVTCGRGGIRSLAASTSGLPSASGFSYVIVRPVSRPIACSRPAPGTTCSETQPQRTCMVPAGCTKPLLAWPGAPIML